MKKFILIASFSFLLTACPNKEEVKEMTEDLKSKRNETARIINERDFSLDGLLKAQDYFFNFSEKVHLMLSDVESKKEIQAMVKKAGAKATCQNFIVSKNLWHKLENFCSEGDFYKCSPEIKNYSITLDQFISLLNSELSAAIRRESDCL